MFFIRIRIGPESGSYSSLNDAETKIIRREYFFKIGTYDRVFKTHNLENINYLEKRAVVTRGFCIMVLKEGSGTGSVRHYNGLKRKGSERIQICIHGVADPKLLFLDPDPALALISDPIWN
jgi:hypothetical protein